MIFQIVWLIWLSFALDNGLQSFWLEPGLFIYTAVGNLLLFKLTWIMSMWLWMKFDIKYSPIFKVKHNSPDLLLLINEICTFFVFYAISFVLFFWANSKVFYNSEKDIASSSAALFVLICSFAYWIYSGIQFTVESLSHGLFDKKVFIDFFQAPFTDPDFRDIYAADCLCSMTRVMTDSLYGSCWLVSGAFLHSSHDSSSFGGNYVSCTGQNMYIVATCVQIIPLLLRLIQCIRKGFEKTYVINMGKYSWLSFVILFDAFRTKGEALSDGFFYTFKILAVFYTVYWDVCRDWGLFESGLRLRDPNDSGNSQQGSTRMHRSHSFHDLSESFMPFLRKDRLLPSPWIYYAAIIVNFLLRSLWVLSLSVDSTALVGPQLNFFLATMEILRRCMWGFFRLEKEHLLMAAKDIPGFEALKVQNVADIYLLFGENDSEDEKLREIDEELQCVKGKNKQDLCTEQNA